jgi:N-acetylglucosaminyldiphosphoundecaprenol N-acetyl-beta-D-mannosaminyltransferase
VAFTVGGVRIDALQLDGAASLLLDGTPGRAVHLVNAYTVSLAASDEGLRGRLNAGHLNLADGMPIVWIARHLGLQHMQRRVYGPDLMVLTLDRGGIRSVRHYLYGSTPEVLETLRIRIAERWPTAEVVGAESPSFGEISDGDLQASIQRMSRAGAQVVWVGMGTPKQDDLVARMATIGPHTYVAIGAAFDFLAGTKKQAPSWMQEHGLEWLFRLLSEPRRLWKRYLVGNARFVWTIVRQRPRVSR